MAASVAAVVLLGLLRLEQLDLESQCLAGHLVVEVEGDGLVVLGCDEGGHWATHGVGEHDAHASACVLGTRHLSDGEGDHHVVAAGTVGFLGLEAHGHGLAYLHVAYGDVKAGDHLSGHADKAQRFAAVA